MWLSCGQTLQTFFCLPFNTHMIKPYDDPDECYLPGEWVPPFRMQRSLDGSEMLKYEFRLVGVFEELIRHPPFSNTSFYDRSQIRVVWFFSKWGRKQMKVLKDGVWPRTLFSKTVHWTFVLGAAVQTAGGLRGAAPQMAADMWRVRGSEWLLRCRCAFPSSRNMPT